MLWWSIDWGNVCIELFLLIIKSFIHINFKLYRVYKTNMKHLPVERLEDNAFVLG